MAKIGRPTKYKKEMCQQAINFMSKGYSKDATCAHLKISVDTMYQWIKKNEEFSEAIKEGQLQSLMFWETLGTSGAMGKISGFNSASWIFNMKNRHGWRDKREGDNNNDVENLINALSALSGNLPV